MKLDRSGLPDGMAITVAKTPPHVMGAMKKPLMRCQVMHLDDKVEGLRRGMPSLSRASPASQSFKHPA